MRVSLEETLEKTNIMVIDGSMSTALEALGCDLNDSLWTAKALAEQPELIRQVHLDYFRAGADCGITASYQATIPGLTAKGYSRQEAEDCIARSVELFREARGELVGPGGPGERTGHAAVPGGRGSLRGVPGRRV
ncbi:MAG: homocysteine S-methyltransferase family protein [Dysosmobacter sp.]